MSHVVHHDWPGRLGRLRSRLGALGCDAMLVSTQQNVAYACGFQGSAGWLLVDRTRALLMIDGRYVAAVRHGLSEGSIGPVTAMPVVSRYDQTLAEALAASGTRAIGFEADTVTVATLRGWEAQSPSVAWRATDGLVEQQRLIKDDVELGVMRRAGRALSDVARRLPQIVKAGATERDVARAVDRAIEDAGFSRPAFETIVASGPNSAYPHARPTDRRLQSGDLVLLDFGGVLDGYCVDLTRMAAIGHVAPALASIFEAVEAAQAAAIAAVIGGAQSSDVDRAARDVLDGRGYGAVFCHGTGHGLGRDVHEAPRLTRAESVPAVRLEPGMVVTVEPGAYVEGLGGVRLEDDVLVMAEGREVLTDAPRGLLVV